MEELAITPAIVPDGRVAAAVAAVCARSITMPPPQRAAAFGGDGGGGSGAAGGMGMGMGGQRMGGPVELKLEWRHACQ